MYNCFGNDNINPVTANFNVLLLLSIESSNVIIINICPLVHLEVLLANDSCL